MSMLFGILVGLLAGWFGHVYWLKRQAASAGKQTAQGGGGPGEERY